MMMYQQIKNALFISLLAAGILVGCNDSSNDNPMPQEPATLSKACLTECTPRLAIIAAFGQEADLLLASMKDTKENIVNGKTFTTGTLNGTPVVVVISGISMVNAVMTTQMTIDHFNLKGLIFSGIAGGVNPNLHVGDVVIAKSWAAPGEVYHANSTDTPAPCGTLGDLSCLGLKLMDNVPAYGAGIFLRDTNVINAKNYKNIALKDSFGNIQAYGEMKSDFTVDASMWNIASSVQASTQSSLEAICVDNSSCYKPKIVLGQRGISSGTFLANADYRDYLYKNLAADCVDMETTGVAQTAYANEIPFIAFRSLSDLAGADHDPNVGAFFASGVAQRNAAKLTMAFVQAWASAK
jgi:adenosylhomocysteine nucleosidase